MSTTVIFIRLFFLLISLIFSTAYAVSMPGGFSPLSVGIGLGIGLVIFGFLLGLERLLRNFELRSFNIAMIGLFFGYLMGQALVLILSASLTLGQLDPAPEVFSLLKVMIFLFAAYLGMMMTCRAAEELHLSIPFVKFQAATQKKKDFIVDQSALLDTRLIDLAASGLIDNHLVVPRFLLKEFYANLESLDDSFKGKARRGLEVLKKLEGIQSLGLRYVETDFPEIQDSDQKVTRLSRMLNANIITGDQNRIKQSTIESTEGVRVVNINSLANSLKPLSQSGETLEIKIQRYGKEAGQGVGYLEDGTMVVVNGGADYINKTIKTHVLSVKHTSSGRMIFCNALEGDYEEAEEEAVKSRNPTRSYFALER